MQTYTLWPGRLGMHKLIIFRGIANQEENLQKKYRENGGSSICGAYLHLITLSLNVNTVVIRK